MKRYFPAAMLLLFGLAGCDSSQPPSAPAAQTATSVETVAVVSQKLDTTVSLPAQLLPYQQVDVYPKVNGFIETLLVDRGSRVKKGQMLARLSAPELVAQRAQADAAARAAESQLATAQARLAGDQGTYLHLASAAKTPGVVADNDLFLANQTAAADKAAVAAAEHNAAAAREALRSVQQMESYLAIEAPFDGVVTQRNLHPGALVGPAAGQSGSLPIVRIVDTRRLRLVVPVPEAESATMKEGQAIVFTVPQYPGQSFRAPIARIAHDVDLSTRTMPVELDVQNSDGKLASGSFATVQWPLCRAYTTLFVPSTAITSDQQHSFVIRVQDGKAEWVIVQTEQTVSANVEVFGDLKAGDEVVRTASDSIRNGQSVNATRTKQ